jgi:hypothetical protein
MVAATPPPLPPPSSTPPPAPLPAGEFRNGGLAIRLGGFIEATGIYRSRNEVADAASCWNDISLANPPLNHESELRGTARHSRASVFVQGQPDDVTTVAGYLEIDFLGLASTANSNAANSYNPRVRQAFATYDRSDWGLHVLVGQAWSLLTLNEHGIEPRRENTPLTIDSGNLPGFTYARQPQARVVAGQRAILTVQMSKPSRAAETP